MATATLQLALQKRASIHPARVLLGFVMFTTGFAGLVNEYVLATTATYIMGDSIFHFSLIIATMLATMGLGSWTQQFLSDDGLVDKFSATEILLALTGGFAPLANYLVFAYQPELYGTMSLALSALIGLMIGFEIPLAIRINERYTSSLKQNAAVIFGLDYTGGFVGALVWIYFLLPKYPLTELSFIVSGGNFLVAGVTAVYFWRKGAVRHPRVLAFAMLLTVVALVAGFQRNREWSFAFEQKFYEDRVIYSHTSRFQHIVLTEDPSIKNYELYLNGNKQFSSYDERVYHEFLVHPAMHIAPHAQNVLILGGGDGLALREVLKYKTVKTVTLVDLDPTMVELAKTHPVLKKLNENSFADARINLPSNDLLSGNSVNTKPIYEELDQIDPKTGRKKKEVVAHVQVMHIDASRYLDTVAGFFDVIIIDLPDPNSIELVKLYSQQVFTRVRSRLSQNGVIAIQSTSPFHAKDAFVTIGKTLTAAGITGIPFHQNVPSFGDWGWYLGFRADDRREKIIRERISNWKDLSVPTTHLSPDSFRASMVFLKGALDSKIAGVNSLANPILFEQYSRGGWRIE